METLNTEDIKNIFKKIKVIMQENEDRLFKLDSLMGDGDLGLTMKNGFDKAYGSISDFEEEDIGKVFMKAGMTMASAVPSTMGTLMATGLMRAGKVAKGKTEVGLTDFIDMFDAFVNGIMERGKSKPGEKTIIDALLPFVNGLKEAQENGMQLEEAMEKGYSEAEKGLEKTKEMKSVHGKAVYHSERSAGTEDPGAAAGVLFVKAFYEYSK